MHKNNLILSALCCWVLSACGGGGGSSAASPGSGATTPTNRAPVANIVSSQSVAIDETVVLDGTQSSDADNDNLSYTWTIVSQPNASAISLSGDSASRASFIPSVAGQYVFGLQVNDGQISSSVATVTITVNAPQSPPIAVAGEDRTVDIGATVVLNGSASSAGNGSGLIYTWSLQNSPAGTNVQLENSSQAILSFVPDVVGDYTFQLIVNNGAVISAPSTVTFTAEVADVPPQGKIPPALSASLGEQVFLDASFFTDQSGAALTYTWNILETPQNANIELSDSAAIQPSFVPLLSGTYTFSVIASNGTNISDPAVIQVNISAENLLPTANAGIDQTVLVNTLVQLDGTNSADLDGDTLTYTWAFTDAPQGQDVSLHNPSLISPSFTPNAVGDYSLSLIVNDGLVDSVADTVTISVVALNRPPVAALAQLSSVILGDSVTVNGSQSEDLDGDTMAFRWSLLTKPDESAIDFSANVSSEFNFLPDVVGTYVVQLIVNDGALDSTPVTRLFTVRAPNIPPVANAGIDKEGLPNTELTLDGSASFDKDGDDLTFTWSVVEQPVGSTIELSDVNAVQPTFIPLELGTYVFGLTVFDQEDESTAVQVSVAINAANTAPVAEISGPLAGKVGSSITLSGELSFDLESALTGYTWRLVGPNNSSTTLTSEEGITTSFTPDIAGSYDVFLSVNDGTENSVEVSQTLTITAADSIVNLPPTASAGSDQSVLVGQLVSLDGSLSSDSDGDTISYTWSLVLKPENSVINLSNSSSVSPSFIPDMPGTYLVQLIVNDAQAIPEGITTNVASVVITANEVNSAPIANAGDEQSVLQGATVQLTGGQSTDAQGDTLTFAWRFVTKPQNSVAELSDAQVANPSFTADLVGEYVLGLTVNDGEFDSAMEQVIVRVSAQSAPPIAKISVIEDAYTFVPVLLDGSLSTDVNEDKLSFSWSILQPGATEPQILSSNSASQFSIIPVLTGQHTAILTVSDGEFIAEDRYTFSVAENLILLRANPLDPSQVNQLSIGQEAFSTIIGTVLVSQGEVLTVIDNLRLSALGRDYTITNLRVQTSDSSLNYRPLVNIQDGQVVTEGEELNIEISSTLTNGELVEYRIQFTIAETGQQILLRYAVIVNAV